jgi:hypothetical protein
MEKTAMNVRRYLIISSMLAASAVGCGSGGGERPGANGGTAGTPDTTASGGAVANGGVTGNGGVTANGGVTSTSTAPSCTPAFSPTPGLITDFSSSPAGWHAAYGGGKWGAIGVFTGSIFSFAGPKSTKTANGTSYAEMAASVDTTAAAMVLAGDVASGDYAGGGLSFDECVNTTTYTGVQFTLGGTVAGCDLYFYVQTFDEKPAGPGQVGGCTTGCYVFPGAKLTSTTGVVSVPLATLTGGQLTTAAAIANEMVGIQWQFDSPAPQGDGGQPACTGVNLTITNVSFVP